MGDDRDELEQAVPPTERADDNLRVFPLSRTDKRPVLRRLTTEELQQITELVAEFGLG